MVAISEVEAFNGTLKSSTAATGLVALCVGATTGLGAAAMHALVAATSSPTVYFVGRNPAAGERIIGELTALNASGNYHFLLGDVSVLANIPPICKEVEKREKKLDLLFVTPGTFSLSRDDTADGLPVVFALDYHARFCFTYHLLSLLSKAPDPRVINQWVPGGESVLYEDDLDLAKKYSITREKWHGPTMTTLAMDELATENPHISFIHLHPGSVLTEGFNKMTGFPGFLMRWVARPLIWPFSTPIAVVGQRVLYAATNPSFTASQSSGAAFRVGLESTILPDSKFLQGLRERNMQKTVWDHTLAVFERSNAM